MGFIFTFCFFLLFSLTLVPLVRRYFCIESVVYCLVLLDSFLVGYLKLFCGFYLVIRESDCFQSLSREFTL